MIIIIECSFPLYARNGDEPAADLEEEEPPVVNEEQVEKNEELTQASSAHRSNWTLVVKVNVDDG